MCRLISLCTEIFRLSMACRILRCPGLLIVSLIVYGLRIASTCLSFSLLGGTSSIVWDCRPPAGLQWLVILLLFLRVLYNFRTTCFASPSWTSWILISLTGDFIIEPDSVTWFVIVSRTATCLFFIRFWTFISRLIFSFVFIIDCYYLVLKVFINYVHISKIPLRNFW